MRVLVPLALNLISSDPNPLPGSLDMTSAIIFDLDGTLADTSGCIVEATQHVGRSHGLPKVADEDIRTKIGQPLGFMLSTLFGIQGPLLEPPRMRTVVSNGGIWWVSITVLKS